MRLLLPAFAFVLISTAGISFLSEAPSGAAPVTSANLVSEQGDAIGQGATYSFPTVTYNGLRGGYPTFTVSNATDSFQVWFAAPVGQALTPGTYDDAERFDFRAAGLPGLDVFGDGAGCNTVEGSFTVYQAVYDGSGDVESFSAQFFDHCEGAYPALMGNLSYNATVAPPPLPAEAPEPPESAAINLLKGANGGTAQDSTFSIANPNSIANANGYYTGAGELEFYLSNEPQGSQFQVYLTPPSGSQLAVGTFPIGGSNGASLFVTGDGACGSVSSGSYTVYAISYDANGILNSFAAEFDEQCSGESGSLYGEVRYNSNVDMPSLHSGPALSSSSTQLTFDQATLGTYVGPMDVTLTNNSNSNDQVTGYEVSGDDDFAFDNSQDLCAQLLAPGASCLLEFDFLPGALGVRTEAVTVLDTADSGLTINMSGIGTIGYYQVTAQGAVGYAGDAAFFGDLSSTPLNKPIIAIAPTGDDGGYWLVASDGGIFSFGDAQFYGSTGALHLNKPIVGMAATPDGDGYWLVASDGGIFSFGDAQFYGSTGALALNEPIVGMASMPDGGGYWFSAADGGLFNFGTAPFYGSGTSSGIGQVVGMATDGDPTAQAQSDQPELRHVDKVGASTGIPLGTPHYRG